MLQEFLYQSELGGILEVSQVKAAYEQAVGHGVPKSTVYRMLARHGWRKIAPDRAISSLMPLCKQSLKRLPLLIEQEVVRQQRESRRIRIMFQDEARFGRINDPRRCWGPKAIRPEVGKQIVREYLYAFGAVCPFDGILDSLVLPVVTTEAMSIFLAEVARRHARSLSSCFLMAPAGTVPMILSFQRI